MDGVLVEMDGVLVEMDGVLVEMDGVLVEMDGVLVEVDGVRPLQGSMPGWFKLLQLLFSFNDLGSGKSLLWFVQRGDVLTLWLWSVAKLVHLYLAS
jgi:hypothetical protein